MPVTGDFAKLSRTQQTLRKTGSSAQLTALNQNLGEEGLNLISEGFSSGTNPYGEPWDAPNNLQITGGIRRYAITSVNAGGFQISATDRKAIWHHAPKPRSRWGGKALPTRLQVPTAERGLPAKWSAQFEDVALEFMRRHF
jgi:hypothetical protein